MRKNIPKSIRVHLYQECGGECDYCGDPMEFKSMTVDHIISVYTHEIKSLDDNPNRLSNLRAACRRCNAWKNTFTVEQFRQEISAQIERMNLRVPGYRLAKSYGLVAETLRPVVFHFEKTTDDEQRNQKGPAA